MDQLDLDTARCWIEETCIVLQVDQREVKTSATATPTKLSKKLLHHQQQPTQQPFSLRNVWPRSSLSDSKQRHGFVIKEKKVGAKWSLDLALPEFQPEEVSVTTIENSPEGVDAPDAPTRLLVTASYFATDNSSLDSTMRHEYRREVTLPTGVPLDRVVASFPGNGLLRLAAPLPSSAVKSRRTFVGLVGGSAGGAGAKIASLTRELRHVGTQRRQQQQAAGTSASLPRQTASTADSTTGATAAAGATTATANGHGMTRSGDNRSCAVQ
ncbi:hypothetical protein BOX15_Mlig025978g1 [Macrostomum lignano]|uniref:SHSP domain-containing protein n=1 Tax=Macrostomum lignano TaxID=282301 RepID=A0A267G193_9PLAT|nr:hypothetical protein BOX15_Mlig025978g1 [Macrostomum lignano]